MKEMTLEEVHSVSYEMMKEIHAFCVENNIQYSLAYGSLLGAIRHKGFIPWDDDIDLWMTRPNFDKFTRTFKSKKGYRHLSIYDEDSLMCFDRVYETEKTYVKGMTKGCKGKTGVWIDIMLLDAVPDDENLRNKQYQEFVALNKDINIYKGWLTLWDLRKYKDIARVIVWALAKRKLSYLRSNTASKVHTAQLEKIMEYDNTPSTNYCFFQCGVIYRHEPQELLPAKSFTDYQLAKFEDTEFMIIKDFDNVLKILFGDYMTPPPVNKRKKSHGVCFWR